MPTTAVLDTVSLSLIERAKAEDEDTFNKLYSTYQRVIAVARFITGADIAELIAVSGKRKAEKVDFCTQS